MTRPSRVVADCNIFVSAFLWGGGPLALLALAREGAVELLVSPAMLDEFESAIGKPKLMKAVAASGRTAAAHVAAYFEFVTLIEPAPLGRGYSRDPDDDHVIACALAARADYIVTGDDDLLVLETLNGIQISRVADVLAELAG